MLPSTASSARTGAPDGNTSDKLMEHFAVIQHAVSRMNATFDILVETTNSLVSILQNHDSKSDRWKDVVMAKADKSKTAELLHLNEEKQEEVDVGSRHDSIEDTNVDPNENNNVDTDKFLGEYTDENTDVDGGEAKDDYSDEEDYGKMTEQLCAIDPLFRAWLAMAPRKGHAEILTRQLYHNDPDSTILLQ
ncbi:hypothetical protein HOY80DRAFT_1137800 [Tuber brumale]|nr:hypothetical protein HOY80DRAFT_1137800 [Tuber brumale]